MTATVAGIHLGLDTHANRPAANTVPDGALYSCSDHGLVYKSNYAGNSWATWRASTAVTEILDIPTAETDDTLVLAPDGAGGVEFRAEAGGGGGGLTQAYVGGTSVGGTSGAVVAGETNVQKITLANDCLLSAIEVYVKNAAPTGVLDMSVLLYDDVAGKPVHLLQQARVGYIVYVNLYRVSGTAGDARWLSFPMGRWLPAGDYWIGFTEYSNDSYHNFYWDATGSGYKWNKGGNSFDTDAPDTSGTVYTLTPVSKTFSLRANTVR